MDGEHSEQHEVFHLPAPSAAPLVVAAGMTFTLVGLLAPTLLFLGLGLLAVGVGMWAFGRS